MKIYSYRVDIPKFSPFEKYSLECEPGIIYLVGSNGSGKSRFIESLKEGAAQLIRIQNPRQPRALSYRVVEWKSANYKFRRAVDTKFSHPNQLLSDMGQPTIDFRDVASESDTVIDPKTGFEQRDATIQKRPFFHGEEYTSFEMFSHGTRILFEKFQWGLDSGMSEKQIFPQKLGQSRPQSIIAYWEEPENSLHPNEQKKLAARFRDWYRAQKQIAVNTYKANLFLVISTHSPFLLTDVQSATYCPCQIVTFELGEGKLKNSDVKPLSPPLSILRANKLLGAGISDLIPRRLVVAEESILSLLRAVTENLDWDIDAFMVSSGGDGEVSNRIQEIQATQRHLASISKRWPEREYLRMKYLFIADDEAEAEKWEKSFTPDKNPGLDAKFISFGKAGLEDSYPIKIVAEFLTAEGYDGAAWTGDEKLSEFLKKNSFKFEKDTVGKFKRKLANFVGSKISTPQQLKSHLPRVFDLYEKWKTW